MKRCMAISRNRVTHFRDNENEAGDSGGGDGDGAGSGRGDDGGNA